MVSGINTELVKNKNSSNGLATHAVPCLELQVLGIDMCVSYIAIYQSKRKEYIETHMAVHVTAK